SYFEIFECIETLNPIAIILDVNIPGSNDWNILKLLKSNISVRHIQVHVISEIDYNDIAFEMGAKSFHIKPLSEPGLENLLGEMIEFNNRKLKTVLLVNTHESESERLTELLNNEFISTSYVSSVTEALAELNVRELDCVITDFMLPGIKGLLKFLYTERLAVQVMVFSDKKIDENDLKILEGRHTSILEKSGEFYGKLLNEVLIRMHVNTTVLDVEKIHLIENVMRTEDILDGKKVLIVDDDVRNLFALTAAFERSSLEVLTADSGKEAL